jgi:hypothetical protein|uniref:Uncharacterized protein n=1 Tax=Zea mays TaxID=4577 RepID=B4FLM1_MAIZE|nr:unknown [Zea mays]
MCKLIDCSYLCSFGVRSDITMSWLNSIYVIAKWFKCAPMLCLFTFQCLVCRMLLPTEDAPPNKQNWLGITCNIFLPNAGCLGLDLLHTFFTCSWILSKLLIGLSFTCVTYSAHYCDFFIELGRMVI